MLVPVIVALMLGLAAAILFNMFMRPRPHWIGAAAVGFLVFSVAWFFAWTTVGAPMPQPEPTATVMPSATPTLEMGEAVDATLEPLWLQATVESAYKALTPTVQPSPTPCGWQGACAATLPASTTVAVNPATTEKQGIILVLPHLVWPGFDIVTPNLPLQSSTITPTFTPTATSTPTVVPSATVELYVICDGLPLQPDRQYRWDHENGCFVDP